MESPNSIVETIRRSSLKRATIVTGAVPILILLSSYHRTVVKKLLGKKEVRAPAIPVHIHRVYPMYDQELVWLDLARLGPHDRQRTWKCVAASSVRRPYQASRDGPMASSGV